MKLSYLPPLVLVVLASAVAASSVTSVPAASSTPTNATADAAQVMTREAQVAMSPEQVYEDLKEGNRRFAEGRLTERDYLAQAAETAENGQFPKAIILGCVDSRVPPEILFDQGIGDIFVGRVAGNFENTDLLGSKEFGAKVAGSKLIVVLGHTKCGAVSGAIDGVEMGNLTPMLENFGRAVGEARARVRGTHDTSNDAFVRAVIEENVQNTIGDILARSPLLSSMVDDGELMIVGGVYNISNGLVDWLGE